MKRVSTSLVRANDDQAIHVVITWVTIQKYSAMTGYSVGAIRQKIRRGDLIEGVHYRRAPDRRLNINVHACQQWVGG